LLSSGDLRPAGGGLVRGLEPEAQGLDDGLLARRLADGGGAGRAGAPAGVVPRRLHRGAVRPVRPAGLDHGPRGPRGADGGLTPWAWPTSAGSTTSSTAACG